MTRLTGPTFVLRARCVADGLSGGRIAGGRCAGIPRTSGSMKVCSGGDIECRLIGTKVSLTLGADGI